MDSRLQLPDFVPPMLAHQGEPFDDDEWFFEIKWDGTRVLAFAEPERRRLVNRRRREAYERYPDLDFLDALPPGTLLDGEVVVLSGGKPDFGLLLSREQTRSERQARTAAQVHPATYIAFDQLYHQYAPLLDEPFEQRRERLQATLAACPHPRLLLSDGVVRQGRKFFAEVKARELEGVMAKRRTSRYIPGQRSRSWLKIKGKQYLHCAIVGYVPAARDGDMKSLILAALDDGQLR